MQKGGCGADARVNVMVKKFTFVLPLCRRPLLSFVWMGAPEQCKRKPFVELEVHQTVLRLWLF